jgi:prepilin-type processing-associated H-X9-DG protein
MPIRLSGCGPITGCGDGSPNTRPEFVATITSRDTSFPYHLGNYLVNWGNVTYTQGGVATANPYKGPIPGDPVPFLGAPFALDKSFGLQAITDGTSNALLMAEVISCVPNGSAQDLRGLVYNDGSGGCMFMAYTTPNSKIPDQINTYCVYPYFNNPPCIDIGGNGPAFNAARSYHSGGVNALKADGSAAFYKDSVALPVWRALSTTMGNEVISADSY